VFPSWKTSVLPVNVKRYFLQRLKRLWFGNPVNVCARNKAHFFPPLPPLLSSLSRITGVMVLRYATSNHDQHHHCQHHKHDYLPPSLPSSRAAPVYGSVEERRHVCDNRGEAGR
jgi:hypothetical protein